jgi:hypothetical protein
MQCVTDIQNTSPGVHTDITCQLFLSPLLLLFKLRGYLSQHSCLPTQPAAAVIGLPSYPHLFHPLTLSLVCQVTSLTLLLLFPTFSLNHTNSFSHSPG